MVDRRQAMEEAFDQLEAADPEGTSTERPDLPDHEVIGDDVVVESQDGDDEVLDVVAAKPAKERDATGKFKRGEGLAGQVEEAKIIDKPAVEKPAVIESRAPVSWKPEARQHFGKIPAEVQQEVTRREKEMDNFVRETANVRQYATQMHNIIQPFEAMIRAEGGNAHAAVDSLLKTAYHLRTANPQQKAIMVAQMIKQHAVDVNMLDDALSKVVNGQQPNLQQDPMMQYMQREMAPIKQFITGLQQRQQQIGQQSNVELQTELQTFEADPANAYFNDVREDMADILESAAKRNIKISLSEAYRRATVAHPEISKLIAAERTTASVAQRSAAARRARNASASLPSGGAPAGDAVRTGPISRRSAIEAAWDEAAG